MAPVTSSIRPIRPMGIRESAQSWNSALSKKEVVIGVSIKVGATAFTRTFCGASSTRIRETKVNKVLCGRQNWRQFSGAQ